MNAPAESAGKESPKAATEAAPRQVRCPACGKPALWVDNPWRPFCSERCKNGDLAAWASGDYAIPMYAARSARILGPHPYRYKPGFAGAGERQ